MKAGGAVSLRRLFTSGGAGSLLVFVALVATFSVATPAFLVPSNAQLLVRQGAMLALITFGMTLVITTGGIDLSVGSVVAFAAVITGTGFVSGWGLVPSLAAGLLAGLVCGAITGALVAFLGISFFVATLGMMGVARGLALVMTDGRAIVGMDPAYVSFMRSEVLGLPVPLFFVAVAFVVTHLVRTYTTWGIGLLAIGGNRQAARLSGLPIRRYEMLAYTYLGLLAGIAGIMTLYRMEAAHPQAGLGYEFDAIAAAVIGGAALEGGRGTAYGALLGAAFITVLRNGLAIMGVSLNLQLLIVGLVVAGAFALDHYSHQRVARGVTA